MTSKKIENPAQLDAMLGGKGISIRPRFEEKTGKTIEQYEVECHDAAVTEAALKQAIEDYQYDPEWGKTDEQREAEALRAKAERVKAGQAQFTPEELQKVMAQLLIDQ